MNYSAMDVHIANWGREFAEKGIAPKQKKAFIGSTVQDIPGTLWGDLMNHTRIFCQRVQLGYILSWYYTRSASRIRAKFR